MPNTTNPAQLVKQLAKNHHFALCGITTAQPSSHADYFRQWLADNKHCQMSYLAQNLDTRLDPAKLLPNAKSIICVADTIPTPPDTQPTSITDTHHAANIARYAQITDYHKVIKKRLHHIADTLATHHPDHTFRTCVDTAPLFEREHAARAGLGWIGKHTLLVNKNLGSHLLLGAIVTSLPLDIDQPATDHCGKCHRCIDACPTHCITPHSIDASRCVSYLTIEHRTTIPAKYHRAIANNIFGCDACQSACPFVQNAHTNTYTPANNSTNTTKSAPTSPTYDHLIQKLSPLDVITWTQTDRENAFKKTAIKRAKLDQIRRNAIIIIGNLLEKQPSKHIRTHIQHIANDPNEPRIIRQTAQQALNR